MIELGMHTDNWRTLSGSFEAACESAVKYNLEHIEFAVIHGQYFINAMGYEPGISLQSNPRALRRYLDEKGLRVSQIDGSFPFMGPEGSSFGVQYVQQSIRFAAEIDCPMVDTVDGAFEIEGLSRDDVFRITCDNYRQVLPWAEDYGIVINVEPHGPYTTDIDFMRRMFGLARQRQDAEIRPAPVFFNSRAYFRSSIHCTVPSVRDMTSRFLATAILSHAGAAWSLYSAICSPLAVDTATSLPPSSPR